MACVGKKKRVAARPSQVLLLLHTSGPTRREREAHTMDEKWCEKEGLSLTEPPPPQKKK